MASDAVKDAIKQMLDAERIHVALVAPFFDEDLVMTGERLERVNAAVAQVDAAREAYARALEAEGFSPPAPPPSTV
jgi:hypothetical protein